MSRPQDACQKRYQRFCERYSPKKKEARRVCAWGSRLFPHGLSKNARRVSPGQADLLGCQVTKPGNPHFRPEFVRRAAVFTAANG